VNGALSAVQQIAPGSPAERWVALILGQVVVLSSIVATYLVQRRSGKNLDAKVDDVNTKADDAAVAAQLAAAAVVPISNGFAGKTTAGLDSIKDMIHELRIENTDNLNTLRAEADTNLREIRGLLISHIADHAAADVRRKQ
jgi:flagellar basal body-associated protein FliL